MPLQLSDLVYRGSAVGPLYMESPSPIVVEKTSMAPQQVELFSDWVNVAPISSSPNPYMINVGFKFHVLHADLGNTSGNGAPLIPCLVFTVESTDDGLAYTIAQTQFVYQLPVENSSNLKGFQNIALYSGSAVTKYLKIRCYLSLYGVTNPNGLIRMTAGLCPMASI